MMEILAVNLDCALEESKFNRLLSCVSTEKSKRISRFSRYEDAQRALIGDVLARYMICRLLKIENQKIVFGVNAYGKPVLVNDSRVQFNISHSGKWVVCAVDNREIGIDVEEVKYRATNLCMAERFFAKKEFEQIECKIGTDREEHFISLWTLKESYVKAVGKGLSIPLNSFTISIEDDDISVRSQNESEDCFFKQYRIDEKYIISVCAKNDLFPVGVTILTAEDLYEKVLLL